MMTNANDMGSALKASKMLSNELGTQKGKWGNKGAVKESEWRRHFEASNAALATRMDDILSTVALGAGGKLNRQQLDMKSQDLVVQMMVWLLVVFVFVFLLLLLLFFVFGRVFFLTLRT
jgi:hypothetical protein